MDGCFRRRAFLLLLLTTVVLDEEQSQDGFALRFIDRDLYGTRLDRRDIDADEADDVLRLLSKQ